MSCSIEEHPQAGDIDAELLSGMSARAVAHAHGLNPRTVQRHAAGCLLNRLRQAHQEAEVAPLTPEELLGKVSEIEARALALLDRSESVSDLTCPGCGDSVPGGVSVRDNASALRELRATVELLAKLSFAASERPVIERPDAQLDARIGRALDARLGQTAPAAPLELEAGEEIVDAELVEG